MEGMGPVDQQSLSRLPSAVHLKIPKTANINKFVVVVRCLLKCFICFHVKYNCIHCLLPLKEKLQDSKAPIEYCIHLLVCVQAERNRTKKENEADKFVKTFYRQSIFQMQTQFTVNKIFLHSRLFSENSSH